MITLVHPIKDVVPYLLEDVLEAVPLFGGGGTQEALHLAL
jgi:hypothetical protein